jgi:hypothetical protein
MNIKIGNVYDNGEFFNVEATIEGRAMEFTADKRKQQWGGAGDCQWSDLDELEEPSGLGENLRPYIANLLSRIVGFAPDAE